MATKIFLVCDNLGSFTQNGPVFMNGGAGRSVSRPYIAHFLNSQGLECHAYLKKKIGKEKNNAFLSSSHSTHYKIPAFFCLAIM